MEFRLLINDFNSWKIIKYNVRFKCTSISNNVFHCIDSLWSRFNLLLRRFNCSIGVINTSWGNTENVKAPIYLKFRCFQKYFFHAKLSAIFSTLSAIVPRKQTCGHTVFNLENNRFCKTIFILEIVMRFITG